MKDSSHAEEVLDPQKNTQMYITILTVRGYILIYPSQPKGRPTFGFGLLKPRLNDFKF